MKIFHIGKNLIVGTVFLVRIFGTVSSQEILADDNAMHDVSFSIVSVGPPSIQTQNSNISISDNTFIFSCESTKDEIFSFEFPTSDPSYIQTASISIDGESPINLSKNNDGVWSAQLHIPSSGHHIAVLTLSLSSGEVSTLDYELVVPGGCSTNNSYLPKTQPVTGSKNTIIFSILLSFIFIAFYKLSTTGDKEQIIR